MDRITEELYKRLLSYVDGSPPCEEYQQAVDYSHSFAAKLERFLPLGKQRSVDVVHAEAEYFMRFIDDCREFLKHQEYLKELQFTFTDADESRAEKIANAVKAALKISGEHSAFSDSYSALRVALGGMPDDVASLEKLLLKSIESHDIFTTRFENCRELFAKFEGCRRHIVSRIAEYANTLDIGKAVPIGGLDLPYVRRIMLDMPPGDVPKNSTFQDKKY